MTARHGQPGGYPPGAYRRGADARVYYQLGGLRRGETIRTTIDISLAGLKPGVYVLALTVRGEGGSATRRATVTVTKK